MKFYTAQLFSMLGSVHIQAEFQLDSCWQLLV